MSERMQFWLSHLEAIQAEGISTKAYAAREGLSASSLYEWRRRLAAGTLPGQAPSGEGFAAVRIAPPVAAHSPTACTVVIEAALRLECARLPDADWLAALSVALGDRRR